MEQQSQYIFGDPEQDRLRSETQSRLIGQYLKRHARNFIGLEVQDILDVGCGDGQLGFALQEVYPQAKLVGIDRDPASIQRASASADARDRDARFVVGDIQQGLPEGEFDFALASLVLLHTQQPAAVLRHAFARLRNGGTLLVIDLRHLPPNGVLPSYDRLNALLFTTLGRIGSQPNIVTELPSLLIKAGFVDIERRDSDDDHPMTAANERDLRQVFAAGIGAMYNAREGMAAVTGTPLAEIEAMIVDVMNETVHMNSFEVPPVLAVITARKPLCS